MKPLTCQHNRAGANLRAEAMAFGKQTKTFIRDEWITMKTESKLIKIMPTGQLNTRLRHRSDKGFQATKAG